MKVLRPPGEVYLEVESWQLDFLLVRLKRFATHPRSFFRPDTKTQQEPQNIRSSNAKRSVQSSTLEKSKSR